MSKLLLTKEGLEKIKQELDYVKNVKLPEAQIRFDEATKYYGHGSDEYEYTDSKAERDFYVVRIKNLTKMIETAKII